MDAFEKRSFVVNGGVHTDEQSKLSSPNAYHLAHLFRWTGSTQPGVHSTEGASLEVMPSNGKLTARSSDVVEVCEEEGRYLKIARKENVDHTRERKGSISIQRD